MHCLREALVVEVISSAMLTDTADVMRVTLSAHLIGVVGLLAGCGVDDLFLVFDHSGDVVGQAARIRHQNTD